MKRSCGGSRISRMSAPTRGSAANPGFPIRGTPTSRRGATYYLAKVCRKLRENENYTERGRASKILLCRSATGGSANLLLAKESTLKWELLGRVGSNLLRPLPESATGWAKKSKKAWDLRLVRTRPVRLSTVSKVWKQRLPKHHRVTNDTGERYLGLSESFPLQAD